MNMSQVFVWAKGKRQCLMTTPVDMCMLHVFLFVVSLCVHAYETICCRGNGMRFQCPNTFWWRRDNCNFLLVKLLTFNMLCECSIVTHQFLHWSYELITEEKILQPFNFMRNDKPILLLDYQPFMVVYHCELCWKYPWNLLYTLLSLWKRHPKVKVTTCLMCIDLNLDLTWLSNLQYLPL